MSQKTINFADNPYGEELLDDYLAPLQNNILTSNSGESRPAYAQQGTKWLDISSTPWLLKMYDGTNDVTLGTVNPSTHLFTPAGLTDVVDYTNITNCITQIPQDIKLELNDGTVTLKAGSKVYVPNGVGVFDEVTVTGDKSWGVATYTSGKIICFYNTTNNKLFALNDYSCFSGSSAPSGYVNMVWYDISNNKIKWTSNSGGSWNEGLNER